MKGRVFVVALVVAAGIVTLPVFAKTSSVSADVQAKLDAIANLMKQIQALRDQVNALQTQQVELQAQTKNSVTELLTMLRQGSEGDAVVALQALLAADPGIYPEGLITGYYGRLTALAVKRFQVLHGLEQVGFVGPRTLAKLKELSDKLQLAFEERDAEEVKEIEKEIREELRDARKEAHDELRDTRKDAKEQLKKERKFVQAVRRIARLCARISPERLNALGWLRRTDGVTQLIPFCDSLPPVVPPPPHATSTDVFAPIVFGVAAHPSTSTATITWFTSEHATSRVLYGTSTAYGASTTLDTDLMVNHSQQLTGLVPSTMYHYKVFSKDAAGNEGSSGDRTLTTLAHSVADITAPVISSIAVTPSSTSFAASWITNEGATSQVLYGTSTSYGLSTAFDSTLFTNHAQTAIGLSASTTYHVRILSMDAAGNIGSSVGQMVITTAMPPPPDTTAPVISVVSAAPSSTSAVISWTTNESSTSRVYYSTSTPVDIANTSTLMVSDSTLVASHGLTIGSLNASTTYYYVVESADAAANKATSSQQVFTATP